jgi:UDP-N-acetylglucosamine--N-acetylmuramyl-(pentapeptide) pyrophosphoryl-undecaprenol N-acetylglucosamine transferase
VLRTPGLPAPGNGTPGEVAPLAPSWSAPGQGETVAVFSGGGTGGHLYPALALASGLRSLHPEIRTFFVGARNGLEARVLPERGLDHLLLPIRGLRRGAILENLGVLVSLFRSLFLTGEAFLRLRPKMVVVTGGYAGGPAGLIAGLMGIPLALQEQNAQPGVTTRVLSRWSQQIHLAFPEALSRLPGRARLRASVSGNPIRTPAQGGSAEARTHFGLDPKARVVRWWWEGARAARR